MDSKQDLCTKCGLGLTLENCMQDPDMCICDQCIDDDKVKSVRLSAVDLLSFVQGMGHPVADKCTVSFGHHYVDITWRPSDVVWNTEGGGVIIGKPDITVNRK